MCACLFVMLFVCVWAGVGFVCGVLLLFVLCVVPLCLLLFCLVVGVRCVGVVCVACVVLDVFRLSCCCGYCVSRAWLCVCVVVGVV